MRLFRLVIITGVLLILVAAAAVEYTSRPDFCNTCHEMKPMYGSWTQSAHSEVACLKCHAKPGVTGLIQTKYNGLVQVYMHLANNYVRPITIKDDSWEFSQRCLACHEDKKNGTNSGPHNEEHLAMKFPCTKCHAGLVHDPQKNTTVPSREICVGCHGTTQPSGK